MSLSKLSVIEAASLAVTLLVAACTQSEHPADDQAFSKIKGVEFVSRSVLTAPPSGQETAQPSQPPQQTKQAITGEMLVGLKTSRLQSSETTLNNHGLTSIEKMGDTHLVQVNQANYLEILQELARDSSIRFAEPNYVVRLNQVIPNDDRFGDLFGLHNVGQLSGRVDADIDAPEAWELTKGSNGVVVGVIDTGIDYTHPDLMGNLWTNPNEVAGNGIDDDANGYVDDIHGINAITNTGNPMDDQGHGTHCSGTIGAVQNGVGVVGVAWNVRLAGCKFLSSSGSGNISDAVKCFQYFNKLKNVKNINVVITSNSWGGGGFSQAVKDAIDGVDQPGLQPILHVIAAGNSGVDSDASPQYPAAYSSGNILAVAASDRLDAYASFSNYGATTIDLAAPGVSILSTVPRGTCSLCDASGYKLLSGTSMATPHVSGGAALVASMTMTPTAALIKSTLMGSTDPITDVTRRTVTNGRMNVHRAVTSFETDPTPPSAISDLRLFQRGFNDASLSLTATGDDGIVGTASAYDLRYSLQPITNDSEFAAAASVVGEPAPLAPGTVQTIALSGLTHSTVYYAAVKVLDNVGNASGLSNTVSFTTRLVTVFFTDGFESGLSNWSAAAPWGVTSLHKVSGLYSVTDSPSGSYVNNLNIALTSRSIDLRTAPANANLVFSHKYALEFGFDYGYIEASRDGGASWTQLGNRFNGTLSSFTTASTSMAAYAGLSDVRIRFRLTTDSSVVYDGWYIDDVRIESVPANQLPVADSLSLTLNEDASLNIALTGRDPEAEPISFRVTTNPQNGSLSGTPPNVVYTPSANFNGTDTFLFKVNDGIADSAAATITLTVNPVNDAPIADPLSLTTQEDTTAWLELVARDIDGDAVTYSFTVPAKGILLGTAPKLTYVPNLNAVGSDSFSFTVSDATSTSLPATVTIQISPVNDAPVAVSKTVRTDEDTEVLFAIDATDADGDSLSFQLMSIPAHGAIAGLLPNIRYRPGLNFTGSDEIRFRVSDGIATSEVGVITIEVLPINDAPVALPQSISLAEDGRISVKLAATDVDGDALTYAVGTPPGHGRLEGTAPELSYIPDTDFTGTDSFTFVARDAALASNEATISITVSAVDDLPVADNQSVAVQEDTDVAITLTGSDAERAPLTFAIMRGPLHGRLEATAPLVRYVPNADFNGADSFTFTVSANDIVSLPGTVTIAVAPVNDAPTAGNITASTEDDVPVEIELRGQDIDGDLLTISLVSPPSAGTLSTMGERVVYTPRSGLSGTDEFQYRVSDGTLQSGVVKTSIRVYRPTPIASDEFDSNSRDSGFGWDSGWEAVSGASVIPNVFALRGRFQVKLPGTGSFTRTFRVPATQGTFGLSVHFWARQTGFASADRLAVSLGTARTAGPSPESLSRVMSLGSSQLDRNYRKYSVAIPAALVSELTSDSLTLRFANESALANVHFDSVSVIVDRFGVQDNQPPVVSVEQVFITRSAAPLAILPEVLDPESRLTTLEVLEQPTHGTLVSETEGFTYTSDAEFVGLDSFTVQARDAAGTRVLMSSPTRLFVRVGDIASPGATDGFESKNLSGGMGWLAPWTSSGVYSFTSASRALSGLTSLQLSGGRAASFRRTWVNTDNGLTTLALKMNASAFTSLDSAEVRVSEDRVNWTVVKRIDVSNASERALSFALGEVSPASLTVAIETNIRASSRKLILDDVVIGKR